MLAQPQETLDLLHKQGKSVAATCLAFPQGGVNNFVVGSEEGTVYSGKSSLKLYVRTINTYSTADRWLKHSL